MMTGRAPLLLMCLYVAMSCFRFYIMQLQEFIQNTMLVDVVGLARISHGTVEAGPTNLRLKPTSPRRAVVTSRQRSGSPEFAVSNQIADIS